MLRVTGLSSAAQPASAGDPPSHLTVDQRRKQVTLLEPPSGALSSAEDAPQDRRVGVAAPKMFAFDAIYTDDDTQSEVCGGALTDLLHAVLNGNDGVLFCFGHSRQDAARTMLGTPQDASTLGAAPCAIAWLFRGIAELRARGGARFSVRVSAVEASGARKPLRDLLAAHAHDSEQSPGVYLRDDPVLGTQLQNHCELRVPSAEKAAHYLDCALAARTEDTNQESHLFFTLHVYQYSVAGKGGVAGGRSRLHLVDLGGLDRGGGGARAASSGGTPALQLSGLGHVLLAIFNGQKHLPHREQRVTQLLKECLSPITCHAAMLVHVSGSQSHAETLATVQLASRIHRMRRRKIKFPGSGGPTAGGGLAPEDLAARTGSSDLEPSSSEQSADTVIYVGPADEATDGEHPPVYLPGLGEGDHRAAMGRALRGSSAEHRAPRASRVRSTGQQSSPKSSPVRTLSAKGSPAKKPGVGVAVPGVAGGAEERWIDGPRVSKSKVVEARTLILKEGHAKKETWVDGPMQAVKGSNGLSHIGNGPASGSYGYMDSHKKSMIRRWVENQTVHMKHLGIHLEPQELVALELEEQQQDDGLVDPKLMPDSRLGRRCSGRLSIGSRLRHEDDARVRCAEIRNSNGLDANLLAADAKRSKEQRPVHLPLSSTTASAEPPGIAPALPPSSDSCPQALAPAQLAEDVSSNRDKGSEVGSVVTEDDLSSSEVNGGLDGDGDVDDEDVLLEVTNVGDDMEIIEVMEPSEPVPMQDSCLQVTEEDIAFCMGENPLPEVDQGGPEEHPLRVLSQENLTVVSTFADSMSVASDLEPGFCPRFAHTASFHLMSRSPVLGRLTGSSATPPSSPPSCRHARRGSGGEASRLQLARLHDLYRSKLAATTCRRTPMSSVSSGLDLPAVPRSRCTSLSLSDVLHGLGSNGAVSECGDVDGDARGFGASDPVNDAGSIYSEPAYQPSPCTATALDAVRTGHGLGGVTTCNGNLCDNCHRSFSATWQCVNPQSAGSQASVHRYYGNLRHPDGASNPDLKEEVRGSMAATCEEIERKIDAKLKAASSAIVPADPAATELPAVDSDEEPLPVVPPPLPSSPTSRLHQRLLSLSDQSASPRSSTPVSGDLAVLPGLPAVSGPGSGSAGSGGSGGSGSGAHGSSSGYESLGSAPPSCSGRDSGKEDAPGSYCRDDDVSRGWASCRDSARGSHHPAATRRDAQDSKAAREARQALQARHWAYERSPTAGCLPDTWTWCWCSPWTGDKCGRALPAATAAATAGPAEDTR